jgi:prophage regulatory protein
MSITIEQIELWREPKVLEVCGLKRSTMRAFVAAGKFPAPVKIGPRASAWNSLLVNAWVRSCIEQPQRAV